MLARCVFSAAPTARFLTALAPLAIAAQFVLVGFGVLKDPAAVQAMTRTGDPHEILRGLLYYGIAFAVCTIMSASRMRPVVAAWVVFCAG